VVLKDGRYGAYVTHGGINATIPKGADQAGLTLDEGLALIAARIAAGVTPKKTATKKAPAKKTATKTAAKKPAAKKPAAKKAPAKKPAAKKPAE
jgi:DNA topoisomerase-1